TALARQRFELRFVQQEPAREDVGLDEIDVTRIMLELPVIEADELQRGAAARLEVPSDAVEISAPPAPPDRLDHFDRRDYVELSGSVAIVLESDLDPVAKPRLADLALRPGLLFGRQGEANHRSAALRGLDRQ